MKPLPRLNESRIGRSESGLIESVDGRSARDYLHTLTDERTQGYRDARLDGTIPKSAVAPVTSTLLDRRTGLLYEAVNRGDRMPTDLHPVLQERLDALQAAAKESPNAYQYRDGTTGGFPHFSTAGTHAEVQNASRALFDRTALGHETTKTSLSEMIVDNRFPYRPDSNSAAPCCANCTAILGGNVGVESIPGKLTNG
ncbi:YwqJ-related putative deaminase [Frankia sp. AgKG'84/4]|uniref:YwqJ-related putative deaminase n=1 Tax=Frankia sp. AgKG'84/4 TaxID=573490 RepID=UPI00200EC8A9|nr:YwqJ-related putative deaminase [Frankia sp. AgKG'84/4]